VALRADADLCARLVAEMVEEPISPDDHDSIVDGLGEFVNMLCGSLCEYASRHGQEIEASSPEEGEPSSPESGDHLLVAHLQSPDGEIDLALLTRG
jgi:CheY-specific phosphatase CheX